MFHRRRYYDLVRASQFGGRLTQQQVVGQNIILAEWERAYDGLDKRFLAYALATTFHETAATMWPIEEWGKGRGHQYGEPSPTTGKRYYGRGFVQLTWEANYRKMGSILKVDLVNRPELALDPKLAALIMFEGMTRGIFTGRRLSHYFDADTADPVNARQIINGNDRDELVASYYRNFLAALEEIQ